MESGAKAVAITNSEKGQLANKSPFSFYLKIQELASFLPGTVTYTSSILSLIMISLELSRYLGRREKQQRYEELIQLSHQIDRSLPDFERQISEWVQEVHGAQRIYFLGIGANVSTAKYAASKFVELTRTQAIPQDLEEFAHSNFWQFSQGDLVVIIDTNGNESQLVGRYDKILKDFGARILVITNNPNVGYGEVIHAPFASERFTPLVFSIPLQLIAYYWSLGDGLNPDTRDHLKTDVSRFKTSRLLSRQSLI
jgi:glucosamine 6-phosphate synthetase-like amidotransferase/phosphosugar isomerase protein